MQGCIHQEFNAAGKRVLFFRRVEQPRLRPCSVAFAYSSPLNGEQCRAGGEAGGKEGGRSGAAGEMGMTRAERVPGQLTHWREKNGPAVNLPVAEVSHRGDGESGLTPLRIK